MPLPFDTIDAALGELDRLRKLLKRAGSTQVRSIDERSIAKATALAWFNKHRPDLSGLSSAGPYNDADAHYHQLLEASDRSCARTTYDALLKALRSSLIALRSESVSVAPAQHASTSDQPPLFSPLIADERMQEILQSRWTECVSCLTAQAPLSATVMMGGLLEALLLARINRESNQASVFQAKCAPRDKTGHTKSLNEWTLKNYIDVGHELGWISVSAKDVGEVLRDYRNYIHPFKQLSHGVDLNTDDSNLLWEVSKAITRQVIASA